MANPQRIPDPRLNDPANPVPPLSTDPAYRAANTDDRGVSNTVVQSNRGSGWLIAGVILVLALAAYFIFMPASVETPGPDAAPPATTEPAPAPDAAAPPAPDATAPAAPADPATPAPDASAPAAPAEPATPAPEGAAPAEPAPAEPAPAPAQ